MSMKRRTFVGSVAFASAQVSNSFSAVSNAKKDWDFIIVGAGTAGLPAAVFASKRGARVLLIDSASKIGGTLNLAMGQIAAAGTKTQKDKGIIDTPDDHYADIMRMTSGLANKDIIRKTVDNAPDTVNWLLDNGLKPLPDHPVTGGSPGRPCYTTARYIWGKNAGKDILAAILKELEPELKSGRVVTQLESDVISLNRSDSGSVEGVTVQTRMDKVSFKGKNILLTTGGYAMNPELFEKLIGEPTYTGGTWPFNFGKGLELAESVGGSLRGYDLHRAGTGSILSSTNFPAKVYSRFTTYPDQRLPWEIWVNNNGDRFIREDEPLTENRASALNDQDDFRYVIIFDEQIFRSSPPGLRGWSREKMLEHFNTHPMFISANTIEELSRKASLNFEGLRKTIIDYNKSVRTGEDSLGRKFMPRQIKNAPYYAVIHHGHSATSAVGIKVDNSLRVLDSNENPIPNLYAAGEVLGSGSTLGKVFTPGMMLTPALTLGRWLGMNLSI